jgi:hypothetical protein
MSDTSKLQLLSFCPFMVIQMASQVLCYYKSIIMVLLRSIEVSYSSSGRLSLQQRYFQIPKQCAEVIFFLDNFLAISPAFV